MKILLLGDLHLRDKAPESRLDLREGALEFQLSLISNLLSAAGDVSAVGLPGDVFNTRAPGVWPLAQFSAFVNASGVPWFATVGQHDLLGHSLERYRDHAYLSLVEKMTNGKFKVLIDSEARCAGATIVGAPWGGKYASAHLTGQDPGWGNPDIVLMHASVSHPGVFGNPDAADLDPHGAKVILYGDIHIPFAPIKVGAGRALGLGVLTWQARNESDYDCARGAVLDTVTGKIELISAPHPDASACFDFTAPAQINNTLMADLELLRSEAQAETAEDTIRKVADRLGATPEAEALAMTHVKRHEHS